MKIPTRLALLPVILLSAACQLGFPPREKRQEALNQLLQTDADFSATVQRDGYRMAFLEFMEDDAVLLRNNYLPIVGADAVKFVTAFNDSTFTIKWDPQGGDVSESEDMGYTWGIYTLTTQAAKQTGTYLTVWRKQKDGSWRFTIDASTQGGDHSPTSEPLP
jgi:ketosteroid isomerase-like protein